MPINPEDAITQSAPAGAAANPSSYILKTRKELKDKGFDYTHKAAEQLRMSGKGSYDPKYKDSKKNK